jgi:hypothetical protein
MAKTQSMQVECSRNSRPVVVSEQKHGRVGRMWRCEGAQKTLCGGEHT